MSFESRFLKEAAKQAAAKKAEKLADVSTSQLSQLNSRRNFPIESSFLIQKSLSLFSSFLFLLLSNFSHTQAQAKARVKAQIEADKKERAERSAREKALRDGTLPSEEKGPISINKPGVTSSISTSQAGKDSKETRLRVRGNEGMWMGSLDADENTLKNLEEKMIQEGKASGPLKVSKPFEEGNA